MPMLHRLNAAGFHVWPYDAPGFPLLIEIYPRILTGPVRKSSRDARARYVAAHGGELDAAMQHAAINSDDAFDALFSALAMWRHRCEIPTLSDAPDATTRLEGAIWRPIGHPLPRMI
jgi:hypothetical protein